MRNRISIVTATVAVIAASYTVTRLRSQSLTADWVPMHLVIQDTLYKQDGSLGQTQISDFRRLKDGSLVQKTTTSDDPVGILEIVNVSTHKGFAIDLISMKAATWTVRDNLGAVRHRLRNCIDNIPSFANVSIAQDPVTASIAGTDTERITEVGTLNGDPTTRIHYLAPSLGCVELGQDFYVGAKTRTVMRAVALEIKDQDPSALQTPAQMEILHYSDWLAQAEANRSKGRP